MRKHHRQNANQLCIDDDQYKEGKHLLHEAGLGAKVNSEAHGWRINNHRIWQAHQIFFFIFRA